MAKVACAGKKHSAGWTPQARVGKNGVHQTFLRGDCPEYVQFPVSIVGEVALSSTPRLLLRLLGSDYRELIKWEYVHIFWSDERSVSPENAQSNYRLAYEELISKISIKTENLHRIRGELTPVDAAKEYELELAGHFGSAAIPVFDLIILGLGEDGHTASLFPGAKALLENKHLAVPTFSESAGNWRVTITPQVLNNASQIIFLVSGSSKARIVGEILGKKQGHGYPAELLRPLHGYISWLIDAEAAAMISDGNYES